MVIFVQGDKHHHMLLHLDDGGVPSRLEHRDHQVFGQSSAVQRQSVKDALMVHADGVGPALFDLNILEHEPALGVGLGLPRGGQPAVGSGNQHQHVETLKCLRAFRAIHHSSADVYGLLSPEGVLFQGG